MRTGWILFLVSAAFAGDHAEHGKARELAPTPYRFPRQELSCTALGDVLKANDWKFPTSFEEWNKLQVAKSGAKVVPTRIAFSRSINPGSLTHIRRITAHAPNYGAGRIDLEPGKLNLSNKLWVAQAFNSHGEPVLEFISRNKNTHENDFGIIEHPYEPSKRRVIFTPRNQCIACHPSGGPEYTEVPWSDTTAVPHSFRAVVWGLAQTNPEKFGPVHREVERLAALWEKKKAETGDDSIEFNDFLMTSKIVKEATDEGLPLIGSSLDRHVVDTDLGVGDANQHLMLVKWLSEQKPEFRRKFSADIVEGVVLNELLGEKAAGPVGKRLSDHMYSVGADIPRYNYELRHRLHDFDPSGITQRGNPFFRKPRPLSEIIEFDKRRAAGKEPFPQVSIPTHPDAFDIGLQVSLKWRYATEEPVDHFTQMIGLHPTELRDVVRELDAAIAKIPGAPKDLKETIVRAALASQEMKRLGADGRPPGAERLIHELAQALDRELKAHGYDGFLRKLPDGIRQAPECPESAGNGGESERPQGAPHRCNECHTGNDPIGGPLPIDPTNTAAWDLWMDSKDPAQRTLAQSWMKKVRGRIANGSMPPRSSDQAKGFDLEKKKLLEYFKRKLGE